VCVCVCVCVWEGPKAPSDMSGQTGVPWPLAGAGAAARRGVAPRRVARTLVGGPFNNHKLGLAKVYGYRYISVYMIYMNPYKGGTRIAGAPSDANDGSSGEGELPSSERASVGCPHVVVGRWAFANRPNA